MFKYLAVRPDMPPPHTWREAIDEVYANGRFTNFGPLVERFESELLQRYGGPEESCVTANNATSALSACLIAARVTGNVLLPAFTFAASFGAIRGAGATPIVVDVSPDDWTLSSDALAQHLAKRDVDAVMLVAPFGMKRDFRTHVEICERAGVVTVIDNAAGLGLPRTAATGDRVFEVFSLHATKPFAVGEGGAIFARSTHRDRLRSAMNFGLTPAEDGPLWGFNGKMSEFHAAVGLAQCRRIDTLIARRHDFVSKYHALLRGYANVAYPNDAGVAPWQMFPVLFPSKEDVEALLALCAKQGVELRRYYRPSISTWPKAECAEACPVSESLADRMCCLPVYSNASASEEDEILRVVGDALSTVLRHAVKA